MNCGRCGRPLRDGARFCGGCGSPVGVVAPVSADPSVAAVQAALAPFPELGALRDGPSAMPSVVVVGETGRGRTTVATLLIDADVGRVATIQDLPPLDLPEALESEVVPAVLGADVVVAVVSATQLLSATERAILLHRVFPLAAGDVALVVTRVDALEMPEDHADLDRRLARFVEATGRTLPIFRVGRIEGGFTGEGLGVYVWEAAERARRDAKRLWARRVLRALPHATEPAAYDSDAAVDTEAEVALAEARTLNHSRIAGLRATLPDRMAAMPFERMRAEAAAVLTGQVQALAHELSQAYLSALERELSAHPAEGARASAAGLAGATAAEGEQRLRGVERAPQVAGSRPRSLGAMALGGAGVVAMVAVGGPVGLASGAAMLYGAWATRKEQQQRFEATSGDDTRAAVRAWLDENERLFDVRLGELSADVVAKIKVRLAAVRPTPRANPAQVEAVRTLAEQL